MTSFDFSRYYLGRPRTAKPERHPDFEAWLRRFYRLRWARSYP